MNNILAATGIFAQAWFVALFVVLAIVIIIFVLDVNYRYFAKALLDFLAALICVIVASPVFLVLAIIGNRKLKAHGGGRLLVRTLIIGRKCKKVYVHSYALSAFNGEYLGSYADALKSSHLVNLPRLLDVLSGTLSIIGPKALPAHNFKYIDEIYHDRYKIRPGILSPLVVRGNKDMTYEDVFAKECEYVIKREMFRDIGILFMSFVNYTRGEHSNAQGESYDKDYCEVLLDRGVITQEDIENAYHDFKYGSSDVTILNPTS